ncbi:MAG: hypothetical protein IPK28_15450 [Devosia sp.]|nr:hypothetical protein [Devosia sp.]
MGSATYDWGSQLVRLRFQYGSTLVFAIVLPVALRWGGEIDGWLNPLQLNTTLASAFAILIGMMSLRQIGAAGRSRGVLPRAGHAGELLGRAAGDAFWTHPV